MDIPRTAGKIFEVGSNIAFHTPVVGWRIKGMLDQSQLVVRLLDSEGHDELDRRRDHLRVVESLPEHEEDAAQRRQETARFAAELLSGHIEEIPPDFRSPVQALMDETLSHVSPESPDIDI